MQLEAGRRFGPYEVMSPLGAGGMGEVYRARDTRLSRDVALKVVSTEKAGDSDRLQRFEQEARAVAALSHSNILAVHDVGTDDGVSYAVFELLEGQTLREKLEGGPVPVAKAVEYAVRVCRGLDAAHGRGIIHRDLKPENLFITSDGQVKILDFGLAKLAAPDEDTTPADAGARPLTASGTWVGTTGYMAPEQARGVHGDARSDVFALGAILYEMLGGRPAFPGATSADRMAAVLHVDPPEMTSGPTPVPALLERVVRRCLEKDPQERFQTVRDLAFALETSVGPSPPSGSGPAPGSPRTRWLQWGLAGLMLSAAAAGAFYWSSRQTALSLSFKQLTYRRGMVLGGRFTADGQTVAYSALFDGNPAETYSMRLGRPEALLHGLPPAHLVGVSSSGEMAVILGEPGERRMMWEGTLARVPISGGAPREVLENVRWADWSPDGQDFAVLHRVDGEWQLEYPIGRVLQRPVVGLGQPEFEMRVSPRGDALAFTAGDLVVVLDRTGRPTVLKGAHGRVVGLAWEPSGDALWAAAYSSAEGSSLLRLGLDGTVRQVTRLPGPVKVLDMSRDRRLLVRVGFQRAGIRGKAAGETSERDLGVFSGSIGFSLTEDGSQILINETSQQGLDPFNTTWVFLRSLRGGPPVRVAYGGASGISRDGRLALISSYDAARKPVYVVTPTRAGTPKTLNTSGMVDGGWGWFVDEARVIVNARGPKGPQAYLLDVAGSAPVPVAPPGVNLLVHSLKGGEAIGAGPDGTLAWYPVAGGPSRPIPARLPANTFAAGATSDGRILFIERRSVPGLLDRLDLTTGRRTPWKTLLPDDPAGVVSIAGSEVALDGNAYAYCYVRALQDLYLVDGLQR